MYIESESRKVYDVEIQTSRKPDIARRTRAYHAMMGGDILDKYRSGGRTYSDIPDTFVIFICTFDPFSMGKHNAKWRGEYMKAVIERNEAVAEGDRLRQIKTVKLMIAQGFDEKTIQAISELPVDEIRKLAESLA